MALRRNKAVLVANSSVVRKPFHAKWLDVARVFIIMRMSEFLFFFFNELLSSPSVLSDRNDVAQFSHSKFIPFLWWKHVPIHIALDSLVFVLVSQTAPNHGNVR